MLTRSLFIKKLSDTFLEAVRTKAQTKNKYESLVVSRKSFIRSGAALGYLAFLPLGCADFSQKKNKPSVAILGGGISGLSAAYMFKKAGIEANVYEDSGRTGGRVFTVKNLMGEGLVTEMGGEFIDSTHHELLMMARDLGLQLYDTAKDEAKHHLEGRLAVVDGKPIRHEEMVKAFSVVAPKMLDDIEKISPYVSFQKSTEEDRKLDNTSIASYVKSLGVDDWLYKLIDAAYTSEMGIDIDHQSALNLLTFPVNADLYFGESDERYKIKGGNQRITDEIAKQLEPQIHLGHRVDRIKKVGQAYELTFGNGKTATADYLIVTLPFPKLAEVDLQIPLSDAKRKAVKELELGSGAKVFIGVNDRIWRRRNRSGVVISDVFQTGWDNSQCQDVQGTYGGYSILLGGEKGENVNNAHIKDYAQSINLAMPEFLKYTNGKTAVMNWKNFAFSHGSYSCYKVGQWTSIKGAEATPEGNVYFAGEHCSEDFQGFMNGAVKSAWQATLDILNNINSRS